MNTENVFLQDDTVSYTTQTSLSGCGGNRKLHSKLEILVTVVNIHCVDGIS